MTRATRSSTTLFEKPGSLERKSHEDKLSEHKSHEESVQSILPKLLLQNIRVGKSVSKAPKLSDFSTNIFSPFEYKGSLNTNEDIDLFADFWSLETLEQSKQLKKSTNKAHKCELDSCLLCIQAESKSKMDALPRAPKYTPPIHIERQLYFINADTPEKQETLPYLRTIHHPMHNNNYNNTYDPRLNGSTNYTFGNMRDRQESFIEPDSTAQCLITHGNDDDFRTNEVDKEWDYTRYHSELATYVQRINEFYVPIESIKPMVNIFKNHPHFNLGNDDYLRSTHEFMLNTSGHGISKGHEAVIPMNCIKIPMLAPDKCEIIAAADTMSDIDCMGMNPTIYYRNRGLIKHDLHGISVMTGNGRMFCRDYVNVTLRCEDNKEIRKKFWCLENLPSFDWLVGKHTLPQIGYSLQRTYTEYKHNPTNIDNIEQELDDLLCSNYPLVVEPKLDFSNLKIDDPTLSPFIIKQLQEYESIIAKHEFDSGTMKGAEFHIDLKPDHQYERNGFMTKEYWMNYETKCEAQIQINGLCKFGLCSRIEKAKYVSGIFVVPKKTGDIRIVFDYRKINSITERRRYTIPRTQELLAKFKGKNYITSLDLKGGYWHIPIREKDRHKTAFIFNGNIYQWNVMPFGPMNAPEYFQQCMSRLFGEIPFVVTYIDDISILSDTKEEHMQHLKIVFDILKKNCLKLRIDKCIFGVSETEYLGFVVDKMGVIPKSDYVRKIMDVPMPKTKTQMQRFIGLIQYLHRFLPHLQNDLSVLTPLVGSTAPKTLSLNDAQKTAFRNLKAAVQSTKHLVHPNIKESFHIFTDASQYGIGAMLAQIDPNDGIMKPVSYCSKVFNSTQQNWHVSEQELYAVIYAAEKWSHLLRYGEYHIHTDHKNLKQLLNKSRDFKSGKLFRWAVRLQDHCFKCSFIRGKDNVVADYLSRDSVMAQHPQYKVVSEFYEANPSPIRRHLSNTSGIDISALYMRHLHIQSLNSGTNGYYLPSHNDPYECLFLNDGLSQINDLKVQRLLEQTDHYLSQYERDFLLPSQYASWDDGFNSESRINYSHPNLLIADIFSKGAAEEYAPDESSSESDVQNDSSPSLSDSDIEIMNSGRDRKVPNQTNKRITRSAHASGAHSQNVRTPLVKPKAAYAYVYGDHAANVPLVNVPLLNPIAPLSAINDAMNTDTISDAHIDSKHMEDSDGDTIINAVDGTQRVGVAESMDTNAQIVNVSHGDDQIEERRPGKARPVGQVDISSVVDKPIHSHRNSDKMEMSEDSVSPPAPIEDHKQQDHVEQRKGYATDRQYNFARDEVIDIPYAYPPVHEIDKAFADFRNIPSPPPFEEKKDIIKVRKLSYKLRESTLAQSKPKIRHIPLKIRAFDGLTNEDLAIAENRVIRQANIDAHIVLNTRVFDAKPTEHVWNANLLIPRYTVPIAEYGHVLSSDTHTSRTLLRLKQRENCYIWGILNYEKTGNNLIPNDFPKYLKNYVLNGRYCIDDSHILCYKHGRTNRKLRVVPPALRQSLIDHAHSGHNNIRHGPNVHFHHGADKMIRILQHTLGYWWPKMEKHIRIHCQCCNTCQHTKPGVFRKWKGSGKMKLFVATRFGEQISVDIVGPLPTSHSMNRYIVSMIDSFSRYCMLVPVKSIMAMDIVHAIDRWVTTFGPPKSILSDNGPQFISEIYKDFNENCRDGERGIIRKYTTTYHAQTNGQIERLHRWIKERLCVIAYDGAMNFVDGTDDWADYLSIIQYTYNTTPTRMTTYSPMRIVLGHDAYHFPKFKFDPSKPEEYLRYMANRQAIIMNDAEEQQRIYDAYRKQQHDKNRNLKLHYELHQRVLYNINSHFVGNAHKLGPKWVGPYEITAMFNEGQSYELTVIPQLGKNANNPMNIHITPRRAVNEYAKANSDDVELNDHVGRNIKEAIAFIVPRNQIKPYYDRFEAQFEGEQTPTEVALNVLRNEIDDLKDRHLKACVYDSKWHLTGHGSILFIGLTPDSDGHRSAESATMLELKDVSNHPRYRHGCYGYDQLYDKPELEACEHALHCAADCEGQDSWFMRQQLTLLSKAHLQFHSY